MFYLFGWGETTNKNIASIRIKCKRCGHLSRFDLKIIRSWFSFFFIPCVPYARRYWFLCHNCDSGYKFEDKEEFERFRKKLLAFKAKKIKRLTLGI